MPAITFDFNARHWPVPLLAEQLLADGVFAVSAKSSVFVGADALTHGNFNATI